MGDKSPRGGWIGYMLVAGILAWAMLGYSCARAEVISVTPENFSQGGDVERMAAAVQRLGIRGDEIEVRGDCWSSCVMLLALGHQVCTTMRSRWGFHGPSSRYHGIPLPERREAQLVDLIAEHLPGPLAAAYREDWSRSTEFHVIPGARLIAAGYLEDCR